MQHDSVAVMAWSYAGESAYALQQVEPSVKVVVSLTSNVLENWVYRPGQAAQPERMRVPYVLLDDRDKQVPKGMFDAAARTFFIRMNTMAHGSFNVLEGAVPSVMTAYTHVERGNRRLQRSQPRRKRTLQPSPEVGKPERTKRGQPMANELKENGSKCQQ